jgi:hypothetical protein
MSIEAHVLLPAVCEMVKQVYIDHTTCHQFTKRQLVKCQPVFSSCLLLVDTEATICHSDAKIVMSKRRTCIDTISMSNGKAGLS